MNSGRLTVRRLEFVMTLWNELSRATTVAGDTILLRRRNDIFEIRFNGLELMSNFYHQSEGSLATRTLWRYGNRPAHVLIGGLGMGFTLRAALDLLDSTSSVTVSELIPEIAEWNRGPLGPLAGHPLQDSRVDLRIVDAMEVLTDHPCTFDVILMDTDNGPDFTVRQVNDRLYGQQGLSAVHRALRPGGIAAFWSATISEPFERNLDVHFWDWHREDIQLIGGRADAFHHIYFASARTDNLANAGKEQARQTSMRAIYA